MLCYVPKALLPEGNDRDVYPRVQANWRAVCVVRAPSVGLRLLAERGVVRETFMSPPGRQLSSQKDPLYSLSLRLLVQV